MVFVSVQEYESSSLSPLGTRGISISQCVEPLQDFVPVKPYITTQWQTGNGILSSRPPLFIDPANGNLQSFCYFLRRKNLHGVRVRQARRRACRIATRGSRLLFGPGIQI